MENVKVIIWGLGATGGGMADMLLKKKGRYSEMYLSQTALMQE